MGEARTDVGDRKLVVLGIPWDVNTDGLRQYMNKYGSLDDVVVMTERKTGRSRGFGYVTFSTSESAQKALESKHVLNGRLLEVKVATPKEEMKSSSKKITRIFVARISSKVTEESFRRHFEQFGTITDIYMPRDQNAKSHRGIGFITYEKPESVARVMAETHELEGATVAVDEATPKDEGGKFASRNDYTGKYSDKDYGSAYGAYSPYIAAAAAPRFGAYGMPPYGAYDYEQRSSGGYGGYSWSRPPPPGLYGGAGIGRPSDFSSTKFSAATVNNRIFVGRLPSEATSEDLRRYFGNFGRILDIYLPKDSKRKGHRGFSFVTFTDEGTAERVARRSHELLGHEIVVERADPPDDAVTRDEYTGLTGASMGLSGAGAGPAAYGGGSTYESSLDYYSRWAAASGGGVGPVVTGDGGPLGGGSRASRTDYRYRPY